MNRPPLFERFIEMGIRVSAGVAIVGLILIFFFIGKEALPLFTSAEARQEASLSKLFVAQVPEEGEPAGSHVATGVGPAQIFPLASDHWHT
jgi:phosphate transport system permease protein